MSTQSVIVSAFFPTQYLATAANTIFTVPTTPTTNAFARGRIRLCNTDSGGAHTPTVYAVPFGKTPAAQYAFISAKSIAASDFLDSDVPVLGPGDFIAAKADAGNDVTISLIDGMLFA